MALLDRFYRISTEAQWLSDRVLDLRPKGCGFQPHRRHCLVSLSKNVNPSLVLVQPRKTHPFINEISLMGRKESYQTIKTVNQKLCHNEVGYKETVLYMCSSNLLLQLQCTRNARGSFFVNYQWLCSFKIC